MNDELEQIRGGIAGSGFLVTEKEVAPVWHMRFSGNFSHERWNTLEQLLAFEVGFFFHKHNLTHGATLMQHTGVMAEEGRPLPKEEGVTIILQMDPGKEWIGYWLLDHLAGVLPASFNWVHIEKYEVTPEYYSLEARRNSNHRKAGQ